MSGPTATWNAKTVKVTYRNFITGALTPGTWTASIGTRITNTLSDGTKQVFRAGVVGTGNLNITEGSPSLQVDLPTVDDPDNMPQGGTITLTIAFTGGGSETYTLVPLSSWPSVTDLADILDPTIVTGAPPYVIKGVAGGVAALNNAGQVVDASGTPVTGGSSLPVVTVGLGTSGSNFNVGNYASADLALQAAINSLPTGYTGGGGSVLIGPGAFDFVGGVTVPSTIHNLRISGSGMGTVLRWKNGNTFASTVAATNWLITTTDYTVITDLSMDGQSNFTCPIGGVSTYSAGSGSNTRGGGIRVGGGRVWIDRVFISGMAEDGITNDHGIGTKYGEVEIIGCGGTGLNIANAGTGPYSTDNDLSSVWVGSCGTGIRVTQGGAWVNGAHVWGCSGDGIWLGDSSIRVTGSYSETNGGWGINSNGSNRNVISGCDVWANGLNGTQAGGILLAGTSVDNVVMGNQVRDNRYYGIRLTGTAQSNVVQGNVITDSLARVSNDPTTSISYTAAGSHAVGSTFTDTANPAWITSPSAIGLTLVIPGAGASGATLNTQVTAWSNPSTGVYNVTVSPALATAVTAPVYTVHAVAYGITEAASAFNNVITGNVVDRYDAYFAHISTTTPATGLSSVSFNNVGVDLQSWNEQGTISGGTLNLDLRNGGVIHGTLGANITSIGQFGETNRGQLLTVLLTQGAGSYTVAGWPASFKFAGGAAPVFSTTAGRTGTVVFRYDGTNWQEQSRSL